MPSYLSSTQTSGPSRVMISAASSAGEASMNLSGWNSASDAVVEGVVAGQPGQPPDVADEHAGPLDVVERAVEGARDGRLDEALAQADPQVAAEHLDDVLGGQRVGRVRAASEGWPTCAPARRRPRSRRTRRPPRGASG